MDDIFVLDNGPPLVFYVADSHGEVAVDRSVIDDNPDWYVYVGDFETENEHRVLFHLRADPPTAG